MRVLLDTNLLIAYLLSPDQDGTIQNVVEAAFENKYTLLLPKEVVLELKEKLMIKKFLIEHISGESADNFLTAIATAAETISPITEPIPRVGRDRKDDYLLAYAVVGEADYLVSGDNDLQVIKQIANVKIVSPLEFSRILMN